MKGTKHQHTLEALYGEITQIVNQIHIRSDLNAKCALVECL